MKPIWDKNGQLTDYGHKLTQQAQKIARKFILSTRAKGRDVLAVEQVLQRATMFVSAMIRVKQMCQR